MAKIRVDVEIDTETRDYEVVFHNLGNPGAMIDFNEVMDALELVFVKLATRIDCAGEA